MKRLRGLRANSSRRSHAELDNATELDAGNPEELGAQYRDLLRRFPHINVLGGCCGTDHRHIERISLACRAVSLGAGRTGVSNHDRHPARPRGLAWLLVLARFCQTPDQERLRCPGCATPWARSAAKANLASRSPLRRGRATGRGGVSRPPFLVGHSMGGLLVQKYLENHSCPGAVLMASFPPCGTIAAVARLAVRHPIELLKTNLLMRLRPFVVTRNLVRELFFAPETPQEIVDHCFARLQDKSYLAFLDTMMVLPRPRRIQAQVLVLGAEQDAFFIVAEVQSTARAYRTEAEIFPCMGHDMMLDKDWHKVADRVDAWISDIMPPRQECSGPQIVAGS